MTQILLKLRSKTQLKKDWSTFIYLHLQQHCKIHLPEYKINANRHLHRILNAKNTLILKWKERYYLSLKYLTG